MKKCISSIFLLVFTLCCVGCHPSTPPIKNPGITELNLPSRGSIQGITPIKQASGTQPSWGSSWAAVRMVCDFYGKPLENRSITWGFIMGGLFDPSSNLLNDLLEQRGLKAHIFYEENPNKTRIKYFLAQGYPAIAEGQDKEIRTILLTGFDESKGVFTVCDPSTGTYLEMPYKEFNEFHNGVTIVAANKVTIIYHKE
jgi:hypothetical protein